MTRKVWSGGKEGTEVVLYTVKEGGHTWPGRDMAFGLLGKSARNISKKQLTTDKCLPLLPCIASAH